jgi:hypothetical protein
MFEILAGLFEAKIKTCQRRVYKRYSAQDCSMALDLIHSGLTLTAASHRSGVPTTTIFRMMKNCTLHEGPCKDFHKRTMFGQNTGFF